MNSLNRKNITLNELAYLVVDDLTEPASVAEIKALIDRYIGREQDISTVRLALNHLVDTGMIFARTETTDERTLRAGTTEWVSRPARLYFGSKQIPARVTPELVPGVRLKARGDYKPRARKRKRTAARPARPIVATTPARENTSTGMESIERLIEAYVQQRHGDLIAENARLRNIIDGLKRAIM